MKPAYVVIGEQKCGTGWLRDRLHEHPDIYCHPHEINFFNHRRRYERGLAWYEQHFTKGRPGCLHGEKSPDYFWVDRPDADYFPNPLRNIASALPEAKILLCLRNPVYRAISAFNHHLHHRGRRIDPRLLRRHSLMQLMFDERFAFSRLLGILQRGFYAKRLALARRLFGSNLLVLVMEVDIVADPAGGLERVCSHLGVDVQRGQFRLAENRKSRKPSYAALVAGYHAEWLRPVLRYLPTGPGCYVRGDASLIDELRNLYATDIAETLGALGLETRIWHDVSWT